MKSKDKFSVVVSLLLIFFTMATNSCLCPPEEATPEYFKRQERDPRLVGIWNRIDPITGKLPETFLAYEFRADGQYLKLEFINGKYTIIKGPRHYWYTRNGILYVLLVGDGFKANSVVDEYEYKLENDGKILKQKIVGEEGGWDLMPTLIREGAQTN